MTRLPIEREVEIATDLLNECADHGGAVPYADRQDVLRACREAIETLGLTELYHMFRAAFDPTTAYEADENGGLRQLPPIRLVKSGEARSGI